MSCQCVSMMLLVNRVSVKYSISVKQTFASQPLVSWFTFHLSWSTLKLQFKCKVVTLSIAFVCAGGVELNENSTWINPVTVEVHLVVILYVCLFLLGVIPMHPTEPFFFLQKLLYMILELMTVWNLMTANSNYVSSFVDVEVM